MENNIISLVLGFLASSGFWSFVIFLLKNKKKENSEFSNLTKAVQALSRCELRKEYKIFKKDGLDIDDKANFENLYSCYHNLGKNGVMDSIYEEVMNMETKN